MRIKIWLSLVVLGLSSPVFAEDIVLPDVTVVGLRPVPETFIYYETPFFLGRQKMLQFHSNGFHSIGPW